MITITLKNDFHNSTAKFRINSDKETLLNRSTVLRIRNKLCGIKGCCCGGVLGQRGNQGLNIDIAEMAYGEVLIRHGFWG